MDIYSLGLWLITTKTSSVLAFPTALVGRRAIEIPVDAVSAKALEVLKMMMLQINGQHEEAMHEAAAVETV